MQKLLRRLPLKGQAAPLKDTTPENGAGAATEVHRRTTVTVERETLSVIVRRFITVPPDHLTDTDVQPDSEQIQPGSGQK